jgi:hypothetical protein
MKPSLASAAGAQYRITLSAGVAPEDLERLISGILVLQTLAGVAGTGYLWWVNWRSPTPSRLFRRLAQASTLVTAGALLILYPALAAAVQTPRLPFPWTPVLVGAGLFLALSVPPFLSWYVYRVRRAAARERPPRTVPPPGPGD